MSRFLALWTFLSLTAAAAAHADTPPVYYGRWGGLGAGNGQFNAQHGVAVNGSGVVYVADYNNQRIQKFEALGSFVSAWGSFGSDTSQFVGPWAVAVGKTGNVYVAEAAHDRVQESNKDGIFIRTWGTSGSLISQFQTPNGIAVGPNGAVFVSERVGERIQEFDANGGFIRAWGSQGTGDGQFEQPRDVAVGLDGSVYVVDWFNYRLQKFDSTGTFVASWDWSSIGTPGGIAVDPQGNLLVTDTSNGRVLKLDTNGNVLTTFGSLGNGPGQFMMPEKVAVSPSGFIYVSDTQLNFVSLFAPTTVDAGSQGAHGVPFAVQGSIPDPITSRGAIRFDLAARAPVTIGIYDVSGRLVRQVCKDAVYGEGSHELGWDRRDDSGRRVAAGVYQVLVQSAADAGSKKLVVLN